MSTLSVHGAIYLSDDQGDFYYEHVAAFARFVNREILLLVPCKRDTVHAVCALAWRHGWGGFTESGQLTGYASRYSVCLEP